MFSVILPINTSEYSNDFMILIISFISAVNLFLALAALFPRIFLLNLFIAFEVKLVSNPVKLSQFKVTAMFVCAFFPKLLN